MQKTNLIKKFKNTNIDLYLSILFLYTNFIQSVAQLGSVIILGIIGHWFESSLSEIYKCGYYLE